MSTQNHNKYFLKNKEEYQLKEAIDFFLKKVNLKASLKWGEKEYSSRDFFQTPDCLPTIPGWTPKVPLEKGLQDLFN